MNIISTGNGDILFSRVCVADSFLKRLKGLIGLDGLKEGECLVITPCSSIHTFFMRFDIDVAFVDRDMRVLRIVENLTPGKIVMPVKGAYSVIEADSRFSSMKSLKIGDTLETLNK